MTLVVPPIQNTKLLCNNTMMYISGKIEAIEHRLHLPTKGGYAYAVSLVYICTIKTPRVHIMKSSSRSRMEALSEALKEIGLPL